MDEAAAKSDYAPAGVSIRNGPILEDEMDVDQPLTNGHAKRKSRTSTSKIANYNDGSEDESDEDAKPLVCQILSPSCVKVRLDGFWKPWSVLMGSLGKTTKSFEEGRGLGLR
jgi:DNA topoisomerase-1